MNMPVGKQSKEEKTGHTGPTLWLLGRPRDGDEWQSDVGMQLLCPSPAIDPLLYPEGSKKWLVEEGDGLWPTTLSVMGTVGQVRVCLELWGVRNCADRRAQQPLLHIRSCTREGRCPWGQASPLF